MHSYDFFVQSLKFDMYSNNQGYKITKAEICQEF